MLDNFFKGFGNSLAATIFLVLLPIVMMFGATVCWYLLKAIGVEEMRFVWLTAIVSGLLFFYSWHDFLNPKKKG